MTTGFLLAILSPWMIPVVIVLVILINAWSKNEP